MFVQLPILGNVRRLRLGNINLLKICGVMLALVCGIINRGLVADRMPIKVNETFFS
jgi:hypothetical protein